MAAIVDVGNHPISDERLAEEYLDLLARIFADHDAGVMAERLMYGSDWFMVALHPEHDRFLDRYRTMFRARFDDDLTDGFLGGHALAFLGFDDAANPSTRPELLALAEQRRELQTITTARAAEHGLESLAGHRSAFAERVAQVLSDSLEMLPQR